MNQLIEKYRDKRNLLESFYLTIFIPWQWRSRRRLSKIIFLLLKLISSGKIVLFILSGRGRHVEVLIILIFVILHFCLSGSCPIRGSTFVRVSFNG